MVNSEFLNTIGRLQTIKRLPICSISAAIPALEIWAVFPVRMIGGGHAAGIAQLTNSSPRLRHPPGVVSQAQETDRY